MENTPVDDLEPLLAVLRIGATQGLIGPASLRFHIEHSQSFLSLVDAVPDSAVDIGSGGGLPGLVLAYLRPEMHWTLVDGRARSTDFLSEAVEALHLTDRVAVVQARTEELGREEQWRERSLLVTARSYGPPAVVAEGASAILAVGGRLLVSEPPEQPARWPTAPLAELGLEPGPTLRTDSGTFQVLTKVTPIGDRFPRRTGVVVKKPWF